MQEKIKMPEDVVQAYHENEAMDAQPSNGYQLVWMAHWKLTNYKPATQDNNHLLIDCEPREEVREDSVAEQDNIQGRSDVAIDISTSTGTIREATKATKFSIMNENLPEKHGNLRIGSLDFKSFPISEKRDGALSLKGVQCAIYHRGVLKSQTDTSFRNNIVSPRKTEIHLHSEGFLPPNLLMNSSNAIEKNKLTVSAFGWSDVKSTSNMVPYEYNKEGKESDQDPESMTILKNESSAETDTMDINALQEDQHPGDVTLSSNKCPKESQNSLICPGAITSAREGTKAEPVNIAIHDANQEPLKLHTLTGPVDERETSTSKTQSLDLEHLLSHATGHGNAKSCTCGNDSFGSDPSSRWLKRLKLSTSDSALGTKSEKFGETSSHENASTIFSKIMKGGKTSLEPKIISVTEGPKEPDQPATVPSNGRSSFIKANQTVEVALSHPWIQRWSHNPASASSPTKHEMADLDPVMKGLQKKQFPSIAAMALMGKVMGSLQPCEFMKKGSLVVWNTENS